MHASTCLHSLSGTESAPTNRQPNRLCRHAYPPLGYNSHLCNLAEIPPSTACPSIKTTRTVVIREPRRDNRLSSVEGLSGLPSLRELRLDINHLTSLHELKQLPALVELSANTNHIRELPDGFAAGLMSPQDPIPDRNKKSQSALVERAVAYGGRLHKLELYHNRIASVHPRALEGLASLTHLDLGRNQLRTLDGRGLECCPALSTLILSQNLLREPPFPLCLPLLGELWLSGNRLCSMGAWASSPTQATISSSSRDSSQHCTISNQTLTGVSGNSTEGRSRASPQHQDARNSASCEREPEGRCRVRKPDFDNCDEREGRGRTSSGGENGKEVSEVGVWLPTLEVLHLQDNALETLGGRSVFIGCPLLRSFDASFNQLRTPEEMSFSLQACSELEEVRLHDNPASACQNYADVVTLSCTHVSELVRRVTYRLVHGGSKD